MSPAASVHCHCSWVLTPDPSAWSSRPHPLDSTAEASRKSLWKPGIVKPASCATSASHHVTPAPAPPVWALKPLPLPEHHPHSSHRFLGHPGTLPWLPPWRLQPLCPGLSWSPLGHLRLGLYSAHSCRQNCLTPQPTTEMRGLPPTKELQGAHGQHSQSERAGYASIPSQLFPCINSECSRS